METTVTPIRHSTAKIITVVITYWTVSISMVFANKFLVGVSGDSDVSIFVAWAQCLSTTTFSALVICFKKYFYSSTVEFPPLTKDILLNRDFLMLSCIFTGMLTFNNLCLKFVGIAFFQVARSMTLIFTVLLTGLLLRKSVSWKVFGCCLIVAFGFLLGIDQEKVAGTLSFRGITYGLVTSVFVSLNGIYVKRLLNKIKENQALAVTFYMNVGSSVLLLPLCIISGQFHQVITERSPLINLHFYVLLVASGFLSFGIGWASARQIDVTSPVTHHISNNSKSVVQTFLAVVVYHETKSILWWLSNFLVVFGALSYTYCKIQEDSVVVPANNKAVSVDIGNHGGEKKTSSNV